MKKPRQKVFSISKAKRECLLLAVIKNLSPYQKPRQKICLILRVESDCYWSPQKNLSPYKMPKQKIYPISRVESNISLLSLSRTKVKLKLGRGGETKAKDK